MKFWYRLRSALFAGALLAVPLGVTLWVLWQVLEFLDQVIDPRPLLGRPIPGLGIVLLFVALIALGMTARSYVGLKIVGFYEHLLARVPLASSVYQGVKQLLQTLFGPSQTHFRQVVLVQWPREGIWAVAFHTGEAFFQHEGVERTVNIFLPTTPNPTSGFYLMLPESDLIFLDLTVEEAFKLIMSAGLVTPEAVSKLGIGEES